MNISAIPALRDNYIWFCHNRDSQAAVVVDPGQAGPVFNALKQYNAQLEAIFITHHHHDHTGGVAELAAATNARVYGPATEATALVEHPLRQGDSIRLDALGARYRVLDIPGHTLGHIAFYGHGQLFSGDTLFAAGCGRVFEGDAAQMLDSLEKCAALPEETLIYCGHEYTQANLEFALQVEPNNPTISQRLAQVRQWRAQNINSLPSTLALEKATNPFLRCHLPAVKQAAEQFSCKPLQTTVEVFGTIRAWKNQI